LQVPLSTLLQPLEARPDLYALPPEESL